MFPESRVINVAMNGSEVDLPLCPPDLLLSADMDLNFNHSNVTLLPGGELCQEDPMGPPPVFGMGPLILTLTTQPHYAIPINGYLSPILVFLTIINNSLVCVVLLKRHMRSPTNALLVAMAISDMFTGVFPVPIFIHFFGTDRFWEYIPFQWCLAYKYLSELIPTVFHTASIWLTMALAIQRYIYVCHSFKARTWCTVENVIRGTVLIYVLAFLSQLCRFLENYPLAVEVPSAVSPNKTVTGCVMVFHRWAESSKNMYYNIYYWFRVIFIHLVPCISLVVMNALLIYAMKMAQKRRMLLLRQNKKSESKKLKVSV